MDGSWHPNATVAINGTAGNATIDNRSLAEGRGLENGTFNGTELRPNQGITPSSANLTRARFFSNFSYPNGTFIDDPEPMWVRNHAAWVASDELGSILPGVPALVGDLFTAIEWHAVFPSAIVNASISFRYANGGSNCHWEVWAWPDRNWSLRSQILLGDADATDASFSYDLTTIVAGRREFSITLQTQPGSGSSTGRSAIDDFEVLVDYDPKEPAATWTDAQDFDAYPDSNWGYSGGASWEVIEGLSMNGAAMTHVVAPWHPGRSTNATYRQVTATNITTAMLHFNYTCQANGRMEVYAAGTNISRETLILDTGFGPSFRAFDGNVTAATPDRALRLRFWAYNASSPGDCAIDDFALQVSMESDAPSFRRGDYVSPAIDFGMAVNFSRGDLGGSFPALSGVEARVRGGADGAAWSNWTAFERGAALPLEAARYVQVGILIWGFEDGQLPGVASIVVEFFGIVKVEVSADNGSSWVLAATSPTALPGEVTWRANVTLSPGDTTLLVRATDTAQSTNITSRTLRWDAFPPSAPGTPLAVARYLNHTNLHWNWTPAADVGMGVAEYRVSVGTSPGASDVIQNWSVGLSTEIDLPGGVDNRTYYAIIHARDLAGRWGSWSQASSPMTVDLSPPTPLKPARPGAWVNRSAITWRWMQFPDNDSATVSYDVRAGTVPGGSDILTIFGTTDLDFTLTNATEGRPYYLSLRGRDGVGNVGAWGEPSDVTRVDLTPPPQAQAPVGPSGFAALTTGTWRWIGVTDGGSGVSYYDVRAGTTPGREDLVLAQTVEPSHTYVSMAEGIAVYVSIRAVDLAGNGAPWSDPSAPLLPDRTPPGAFSLVAPSTGWTNAVSVAWTWTAADEWISGPPSYAIRIGTGPLMDDVWRETVTTGTNFLLTDAPDGFTVYFSLAAIDGAGNRGVVVEAPPVSIDRTPPSTPVPTDFPTTPTNAPVLFWAWTASDVSGSGIDHFLVALGSAPSQHDLADGLVVQEGRLAYEAAVSGRVYFITIIAVDGVGWESEPSSPVQGTLVDREPPPRPLLSANARITSGPAVTVSWTPVVDAGGSGLSGYLLQVESSTGSEARPFDRNAGVETVAGVDGAAYTLRLRALDGAGNAGEWSEALAVTFDRTPPTTPSGVRMAAVGARVSVEWNASADATTAIAGYWVTVGLAPATDDVVPATFTNVTRYEFDGLPGVRYFVSVRAVDAAGNGATGQGPDAGFLVPEEARLSDELGIPLVAALLGVVVAGLGALRLRKRRRPR